MKYAKPRHKTPVVKGLNEEIEFFTFLTIDPLLSTMLLTVKLRIVN